MIVGVNWWVGGRAGKWAGILQMQKRVRMRAAARLEWLAWHTSCPATALCGCWGRLDLQQRPSNILFKAMLAKATSYWLVPACWLPVRRGARPGQGEHSMAHYTRWPGHLEGLHTMHTMIPLRPDPQQAKPPQHTSWSSPPPPPSPAPG